MSVICFLIVKAYDNWFKVNHHILTFWRTRDKATEYQNYWLVVQGFPILSQCPSGQLLSHLYHFRQERLINNFTFSSLLRFKLNAWWKNEQVHLSIPQIFCMVLFHRDFLLSFNGVSCVIKNTLKLTQGALTMTHF